MSWSSVDCFAGALRLICGFSIPHLGWRNTRFHNIFLVTRRGSCFRDESADEWGRRRDAEIKLKTPRVFCLTSET
jgi:hypothetical protein